jgi:hypothetical protein
MECILDKRVGTKTRRKQYFEYLVKWKEPPSGGCQLGDRGSDSEAWADCTGAHEQEPMKSFEPRSMMQEHRSIHHTSQREEKKLNSWTSQQILFEHFEFHLGIVAPPFTKGIQSRRSLYYI